MALFNRGGNILRQTVTNNEFMSSVTMIRRATNWRLFVGGLGPDVNSTLLREAFSKFGEVIEAKAVINKKSGRCRGYGFVEFPNNRSAWKAFVRMDQWELFGRTVTVKFANNCRDRKYTHEDAIADAADTSDDDDDYW